ncbi:MAG: hypothetical protein FD152_1376 [Xanthobacteraceae bacterium]|nr:MAG: hypothetical protein FD152_1376 [Xanthobacteraceae bacterium]
MVERKRGAIKLNLERGATISEFNSFLSDLEIAYLSIYQLPSLEWLRSLRGLRPYPIGYFDPELFYGGTRIDQMRAQDVYPPDQLEISRITIQSPGWIELMGSLNPLQQLRDYLKDRHERKKDKEWRWKSEKERAEAELEILRIQAERERVGALKEFYDLLDRMELSPEEKRKILWERVGTPLTRLARHQDRGLLGSQDDSTDGPRK